MNTLRVIRPEDFDRQADPVVLDRVLDSARTIVERVRVDGESAVRACATKFAERATDDPLVLGPDAMREAYEGLGANDRDVLERAAQRIERFANAQRESIQPMTIEVPGGFAGHTIEPVGAAGCYAPAGRYPLPSSVLMTAITARAAGCQRVVVASPGAHPVTLAAAHIAGADEFLCVGGAHAIAAMAYGYEGFERCDVIVGPGNAWVTAAKQLVSGVVGIDMLAGPSELLVLADESASVEIIAADLIAQAEHDTDAVPMLLTTCSEHLDLIQAELARQLESLPTGDTAKVAMKNGFVILCDDLDQAVSLSNRIAPEHLQISTKDAQDLALQISNAGAVFIGEQSAEVLGDYGVGPNHTLPTGGTSRFQGGLSVIHFLRFRTWIRMGDGPELRMLAQDTECLAQMEGLIGHQRAVSVRQGRELVK